MTDREIKFRIWNGAEMVYDVTVGKFGVFYVNPTNNGLDPNDSASITPFTTKYHNGTPVMQYTGLKDKNETEIWEGDIVRFKSWRDALQRMEDKTMKVEYLAGFFCPLVSFGDGPYCRDYEVIGNIWENPELIK